MQGEAMQRIRIFLRRDVWMLALLCLCVLLCLMLGRIPADDASAEEVRLARVLSAIEGAGQVDVAIYHTQTEGASVPCGAVVVADGAGDMAVRLRLSRAVVTLLGVDASRVEVFQREGGSSHEQLAP